MSQATTLCIDRIEPTEGPRPNKAMIESVKQYGVIFPVVVWHDIDADTYRLVDGNRRIGAMRAAGLGHETVSVIEIDPSQADAYTLTLNQLRSENFATQAKAVAALIGDGFTKAAITKLTGMPTVTIDKHLRYHACAVNAPTIFDAFDAGQISTSVMDKVIQLTPEQQQQLATVHSGKGKITVADIKTLQEAARGPETHEIDIAYSYHEQDTITYTALAEAVNDLCLRAMTSGLNLIQVVDLVMMSPAFTSKQEAVAW